MKRKTWIHHSASNRSGLSRWRAFYVQVSAANKRGRRRKRRRIKRVGQERARLQSLLFSSSPSRVLLCHVRLKVICVTNLYSYPVAICVFWGCEKIKVKLRRTRTHRKGRRQNRGLSYPKNTKIATDGHESVTNYRVKQARRYDQLCEEMDARKMTCKYQM